MMTARCEYITGCVQFRVTGKSKDGAEPPVAWLDSGELEENHFDVSPEAVKIKTADTGGPQDSPSGPRHP